MAGMEARDLTRLRAAQDALDQRGADEPVVTGIAAAAQFLEQRESPTWRGVDLMRGEETVVEAPPWEYTRNVPAAAPGRPARLVRRDVVTPSAERQRRLDARTRAASRFRDAPAAAPPPRVTSTRPRPTGSSRCGVSSRRATGTSSSMEGAGWCWWTRAGMRCAPSTWSS